MVKDKKSNNIVEIEYDKELESTKNNYEGYEGNILCLNYTFRIIES